MTIIIMSERTHTLSLNHFPGASLVAQMVKNLTVIQETQVWSLGPEVPLEKEMATHSSILACRIPWTEEPGELQSMGSQRVGQDCAINTFTFKNPHSLSQWRKPTIWVNNNSKLWITQNNLLLLSHLKISTYSQSISLHLTKSTVSITPK